MISEGLFERFPVEEIYGMHNWPSGTARRGQPVQGRAMAGAAFDITIKGVGAHAAMPQQSRDAGDRLRAGRADPDHRRAQHRAA